MTKKKLTVLLSDVGIIESAYVPRDKIKDCEPELLQTLESGETYLYKTNDLSQDDITTALLAKLVKNTNTIKAACIFFVVLSVVSIILSIAAVV